MLRNVPKDALFNLLITLVLYMTILATFLYNYYQGIPIYTGTEVWLATLHLRVHLASLPFLMKSNTVMMLLFEIIDFDVTPCSRSNFENTSIGRWQDYAAFTALML